MEDTFLYRYYVGANNRTGVCEQGKAGDYLQEQGIEGFTVLESRGAWKGKQEDSIVIEMVGDKDFMQKLRDIKGGLATLLEQESVLLTCMPIMAQF